jgi:azurin
MIRFSTMRTLLSSTALLLALAATLAADTARTIQITATEQMKFDKTDIEAKPGESLHVVVKSVGSMPKAVMAHNFVLVQQGTDIAKFNAAAFNARETDFIPPDMKSAVIANTGLAGAGETVEVTFKAPTKPGRYEYFCSFPGHYALGMRGVLVVK